MGHKYQVKPPHVHIKLVIEEANYIFLAQFYLLCDNCKQCFYLVCALIPFCSIPVLSPPHPFLPIPLLWLTMYVHFYIKRTSSINTLAHNALLTMFTASFVCISLLVSQFSVMERAPICTHCMDLGNCHKDLQGIPLPVGGMSALLF